MKQPSQSKRSRIEFTDVLQAELAALRDLSISHGLAFDDRQYEEMLVFVRLLLEWNRAFNLISRADEKRIISRHVRESVGLLSLASIPDSSLVLDIGSGGGFPAIPIKILRPDLHFTLIEANGKKASFLRSAGMKLSLQNYMVHEKRVESLKNDELPAQSYVTARAVAELSVLWGWAARCLKPGGMLLTIKGGDTLGEIEAVARLDTKVEIATIRFPEWINVDKSRFVISIMKKTEFEN